MIPPLFLKIHIVENRKSKIRLWLPIILVWLVLLALALALAPFVLVAALILSLWRRRLAIKLLLFGPLFFTVLGSLHNLEILTESPDNKVSISFQ